MRLATVLAAAVLIGGTGMTAARADAAGPKPTVKKAPAAMKPARPATPGVSPEAKAALGSIAQQYNDMRYHAKLTADQQVKVKEQVDAMLKDLMDLHAAAVKKSKDDAAAINATTGAARDKLRQQMADDNEKAQSDFQNLYATHQQAINAALTPEQRVTWETYKIERSLNGLMRGGPAVTEVQWKQIKPLVADAAKELGDSKDAAASRATSAKLMKKLMDDVFTEDQVAHLLGGSPSLMGLGAVPGPKAARVDKNLP